MKRSPWLALALAGCASAPQVYSARSAASVEAAAASRPVIGRALSEEPPPPGAPSEGWAGLADRAEAPAAMHHHHHHPGMVMPAPSEGGEAHAH
ncbi:MAG: hypothetical protein U0234_19980 [Sandaracinus sp.]